jgi:hypothetical protein
MSAAPQDDDWAQALAGRDRPDTDPLARREARVLREALRRWPLPEPQGGPDAPGLKALLDEARAQGLLRRRSWCPGCLERWRRWTASSAGWGGLAVAGVLGLAVLPVLWPPPDPGPETVLRSEAGVTLRTAADPLRERDALASRLRAGGADVQVYARLGRYGLDAEWPGGADDPTRAWLAAEGLPLGPDGSLRVEYAPLAD